MTLRRQLFLTISALFLAILLGLLFLSVRGTRDYLEQQLASHAQDAATALSIPLAQSLGRGDPILAEMQVASVFDRGYFQRIAVLSATGKPVLTKALPLKIDQVPLWFSGMFELHAATGEAFITAGWKQMGKVLVESQPTYAYQYLWTSATEVAMWMALAYLCAMALTQMLLRVILKPLHAIEQTALAVEDRQFKQIDVKPRARELAKVVAAMNNMSRRISKMLDDEMAKAERFRQQAFHDEVSGLENRRAFDLRFGELLRGDASRAWGMIAVLEVDGLKEFNTAGSYSQGNQLLAALAQACQAALGTHGTIQARLGGAAFGLVMAATAEADGQLVCERLHQGLSATLQRLDPAQEVSFALGAVHFHAGDPKGQIMARVDLALEAARQAGRNQLQVMLPTVAEEDALGSQGWRELLRTALKEGRWQLLGQPVREFANNSLLHLEVMVRLTDRQAQAVAAAKFIPMALRHHLMPEVDTAVVSLVLQRLRAAASQATPTRLAINISMQSLQSPPFYAWLSHELQSLAGQAKALAFELSRYGCAQDVELAQKFAAMVRGHGAQFGMDRFGLDPQSLQTLRAIPPDYVKLDTVFADATQLDEAARELMGAIVGLARTLNVMVIAQGVETEAQAQAVAHSHDAGQGYFFGAPAVLDA